MDNKKVRKYLTTEEAVFLGLKTNTICLGRKKAQYSITEQQVELLKIEERLTNRTTSKTTPNDYKNDKNEKFVMSAWNGSTGQNMNIDEYCETYNLPRKDITSYKFISHTGTPHYNIVFKENISKEVEEFDFAGMLEKHTANLKPIDVSEHLPKTFIPHGEGSFDFLTYTDVHVGMDTDSTGNSMYAVEWNKEAILTEARKMVRETLDTKESSILVVDELGDFLDGYNGQTTRGGHALPQNMTNEEAFDCALEFKMIVLNGLVAHYDQILFNNICNDNHAGAFGYFVNSAFKSIAKQSYDNVTVKNHRQFMNHYYMGETCYIITHGKDDSSLKFGFKPFLDSKGIEKIDQYCKQNDIYKHSSKVVFKKGDSHQALFDMCTSDDFFYFNYPALSPSSQWVQTNFKKGRRGFVNETVKKGEIILKPKFI